MKYSNDFLFASVYDIRTRDFNCLGDGPKNLELSAAIRNKVIPNLIDPYSNNIIRNISLTKEPYGPVDIYFETQTNYLFVAVCESDKVKKKMIKNFFTLFEDHFISLEDKSSLSKVRQFLTLFILQFNINPNEMHRMKEYETKVDDIKEDMSRNINLILKGHDGIEIQIDDENSLMSVRDSSCCCTIL
ncbi:hypothetical protein ABK040_015052 [Willaertia magna]